MVTTIPLTVNYRQKSPDFFFFFFEMEISSHSQFDAAATAPPCARIFSELISGAYIHGTFKKL
jgi:hypothetical protein